MKWLTLIQVLSAGFAVLAAYFWWASTKPVFLPENFQFQVMKSIGGVKDGQGGWKMYENAPIVSSADVDFFAKGLSKQSKVSAKAAGFAGASAALQAVAIVWPMFS